ncbi:MAG: nucleotidyltransferase domain-containing protein [Anaerolineales bacterium]|jgi:predicted nucleotidyltransferase
MDKTIIKRLGEIEEEENVKIVYACESGSRAWGFPSSDSDYDVRFIYLHPLEWYLSIEKKRYVIEYPLQEQLDISGWDLQKALLLFRKSNPPLMEWLGSPIVYLEEYSIANQMRVLAKDYFSPVACSYHYLHMAQGNYRDYLKGDNVWLKKYFYVLRPILAVQWIERKFGVVPTEFGRLVEKLVEDPELKTAIDTLILSKRNGKELGYGPRIDSINQFVEQELDRFENNQIEHEKYTAPIEKLNELFINALIEVWGSFNI